MSVLIRKLPYLSSKFMLSAHLLNVFHHYYLALLVRKNPHWSIPQNSECCNFLDTNINFTFIYPIDC